MFSTHNWKKTTAFSLAYKSQKLCTHFWIVSKFLFCDSLLVCLQGWCSRKYISFKLVSKKYQLRLLGKSGSEMIKQATNFRLKMHLTCVTTAGKCPKTLAYNFPALFAHYWPRLCHLMDKKSTNGGKIACYTDMQTNFFPETKREIRIYFAFSLF